MSKEVKEPKEVKMDKPVEGQIAPQEPKQGEQIPPKDGKEPKKDEPKDKEPKNK